MTLKKDALMQNIVPQEIKIAPLQRETQDKAKQEIKMSSSIKESFIYALFWSSTTCYSWSELYKEYLNGFSNLLTWWHHPTLHENTFYGILAVVALDIKPEIPPPFQTMFLKKVETFVLVKLLIILKMFIVVKVQSTIYIILLNCMMQIRKFFLNHLHN